LITTIGWALIEQWLKGEKNENYTLIEGIKLAFGLFSQHRLPPNAVALRDQEYEADEMAVRVTGDLNGAVECLRNLVGNDLDKQSHIWELFGTVVPVMTMRERIATLQGRFPFGVVLPSSSYVSW
jgi:Zn-dependent protease with chaperone function